MSVTVQIRLSMDLADSPYTSHATEYAMHMNARDGLRSVDLPLFRYQQHLDTR